MESFNTEVIEKEQSFTEEEVKVMGENWKDGKAPERCKGKCKLVDGGGILCCHGCGWDDLFNC